MRIKTDYVFENSITVILTKVGVKYLEPELEKIKCKKCGARLSIVTYLEGSVIFCATPGEWHDTGYDVDVISDPPKIVESK